MSTKKYNHRTLVECSVGSTHTVDVLVHLRRADLDWWNSSLPDHQAQLFKLVGRCILPKECSEEIEGNLHDRRKRSRSGVVIGEKNVNSSARGSAASNRSSSNKKGRKAANADRAFKKGRQGDGKGKGDKKTDKYTTTMALSKKEKGKSKYNADVTYIFGETIQLTYRVEEVNTTESATLLYPELNSDSEEGCDADRTSSRSKSKGESKKKAESTAAKFSQLKKLPKRIIVWCYPFDAGNPTAPNPEGGGHPRPELIPITSLFKESR